MSPRISIRLLAGQSDERLLALVRDGHERAFEALVHRYRPALLRYLRRTLGLADPRAEDVLQQALLKAWLGLARGTEVRNVKPWLFRIAHNTALNAIRRPGERHFELVDGALSGFPADDSPLERAIDAREALSGVAALPGMQREAMLLTAIDGHSHEEAARALGISNAAVRGLIYRARAAVRIAAAAITPPPLLAWALGAKVGVGTVANVALVGGFIVALTAIPAVEHLSNDSLGVRIVLLVVAMPLFGVASADFDGAPFCAVTVCVTCATGFTFDSCGGVFAFATKAVRPCERSISPKPFFT